MVFSLVITTLLLSGCGSPVSETGSDSLTGDDASPASTADAQQIQLQQPTAEPTFTISPDLTPSPAVCSEEHGRIERQKIESSLLSDSLYFRLYLPPCFDSPAGYTSPAGHYYSKNWRYPLLFLFHGQTFDDSQWERLGIAQAADVLINNSETPPFIIVMPYEVDSLGDASQSVFGKAVTDELIPWLDNNYPTCTQRMCRAAGGLSRGGAWAVQLGLSRWELFASIGAHSTPPFSGYPVYLPQWLQSIPADQMPRIYMDVGRGDIFRPQIEEFESFLTQLNLAHEWYVRESGDHDEAYWSANLETYLRWYTSVWRDAVFNAQ